MVLLSSHVLLSPTHTFHPTLSSSVLVSISLLSSKHEDGEDSIIISSIRLSYLFLKDRSNEKWWNSELNLVFSIIFLHISSSSISHLCLSPLQVPPSIPLLGFLCFSSFPLINFLFHRLSISQRVSRISLLSSCSSGLSKTQLSVSTQRNEQNLLSVGVGAEALVTSNAPGVSNEPLVAEEKIGVLLLNLGGPENLEDVQPFLFNLFADPVGNLFFCFMYDPF